MIETDFNIWEGIYGSFEETPAGASGFHSDRWIESCIERAQRAKVGSFGPLIPENAETIEYQLSTVAALASRPGRAVRIVDFGGAAGHSYFSIRAALPAKTAIEFYVVEHEALCAAARSVFTDESELCFCSDLDSIPVQTDLVHAGSSLQYVREWGDLLGKIISRCEPELLLLSDIPAGDIETFVTIQNYYGQKMRHWFWNLNEFISRVEDLGYQLIHRTRYIGIFFGKRGVMPMSNFDERHRLRNACHLLFRKV